MEAIPILIFLGPCWLLAGLYYFFGMRKHLRSEPMRILNSNLAKAGLFWSNSDNDVRPLEADSMQLDREKYIRSFLIFTAVLSLFSILGMILLGLIFMTSRSRLELQLMDSPLAKDPSLDPAHIGKALADVKLLV